MRQGLRHMLSEQPELQVVGEADSGRDAIARAAELQPDVIIMDVTMSDLNGVDATRKIREENANRKIIGLSMHPERQFIMEMLAAGASGYLLKDSPLEELLGAIDTVVRGDVFLSPKVTDVLVKQCVSGVAETNGFCGSLSPREREVLQLVAEGKNAKEIGYMLHISSKTVEGHRRQIMDKLKLYSVAELTRYAIREGMSALN
jgi:DNA-binding NarL/FixJ family response regulator